jgi:hypothetical protein
MLAGSDKSKEESVPFMKGPSARRRSELLPARVTMARTNTGAVQRPPPSGRVTLIKPHRF